MDVVNVADGAEQFTSNAYLLDGSVLIDAGADPVVLNRLEDETVETVVITHSHEDHVKMLPGVVWEHGASVQAFAPDMLEVDAQSIGDSDTLNLAGYGFEVLHTPGHIDDHICLYNPEEGVLFSGDLLFPNGSFGRTDLEQGDRDRLIASIERVADRDVQAMYPGHDEPTRAEVNDQIQQSLANARKREPKYQ